jgi:hypothetical protein
MQARKTSKLYCFATVDGGGDVSKLTKRYALSDQLVNLISWPSFAEFSFPSVPNVAPEDRAERRQVTVMFSDLVGSTALSARMDPEDFREVISAYQNSVAETVGRFGGFVAKYMGDGVLIYFGYPQAHEDDAERAVRTGLQLVTAVTAGNSRTSIAPAQPRGSQFYSEWSGFGAPDTLRTCDLRLRDPALISSPAPAIAR